MRPTPKKTFAVPDELMTFLPPYTDTGIPLKPTTRPEMINTAPAVITPLSEREHRI